MFHFRTVTLCVHFPQDLVTLLYRRFLGKYKRESTEQSHRVFVLAGGRG